MRKSLSLDQIKKNFEIYQETPTHELESNELLHSNPRETKAISTCRGLGK